MGNWGVTGSTRLQDLAVIVFNSTPCGNKLVGILDTMGMRFASNFNGTLVGMLSHTYDITSPTKAQENGHQPPLFKGSVGVCWQGPQKGVFILFASPGVYCPLTDSKHFVELNGDGITNTKCRAELAAIAAAITHFYLHIASDSLTSLHQICKQLTYPEKHKQDMQGDVL
eukprot:737993-Pelagomonas_calceolata.AAC.1